METKFYKFTQNNSGGYFVVDDNVCYRLFIEANNIQEAIDKAKELGVYFDGVSKGIDCSCCGDRWYEPWEDEGLELDKWQQEGYPVGIYGYYNNPEQLWQQKYGKFNIVENPKWEKKYTSKKYIGKISFRNIEEYAQCLADEYGRTKPDVRVFYKNGNVKEIFSNKRS